jgi:hypothetical protein
MNKKNIEENAEYIELDPKWNQGESNGVIVNYEGADSITLEFFENFNWKFIYFKRTGDVVKFYCSHDGIKWKLFSTLQNTEDVI